MACGQSVCVAVLYTLVDVVVTTVLYTRGLDFSTFKRDVLNFAIMQSAVDIWGVMLLRASLLLGASTGVLWNREDGPLRVAKLATPVILICMIIISYTLAKLLMVSEVGPLGKQPWFLSLICWTCASTLGVLLPWTLLGRSQSSSSRRRRRRSSGSSGASCEDTKKLVEAASRDEQVAGCDREGLSEEEKQKKEQPSSGATLGRLLSYCRKDGTLLAVAILFLIIAATCECLHSPVKQVITVSLWRPLSDKHLEG